MVTFRELRTAEPAAWYQVCAGLRLLARRLADRGDQASELTRRLRTGWLGSAGAAAAAELDRLRDGVAALPLRVLAADQAIAEYAAELARARVGLTGLVTELRQVGVRVSEEGLVDGLELSAVHDGAQQLAALLSLAAVAERQAQQQLRDVLPVFDTPAVRAPAGPPGGGDPATVHRWWLALTEPQRQWLLVHDATRIGGLDGVPAAVRDQVNRLRLRDAPGLDALRLRLASDRPARAYLIGFDPDAHGGGRAVVAVGDPDHADNVLTYVPGTGESYASMGRMLGRADRILAHTAGSAGSAGSAGLARSAGSTAVVLWLGYEPPRDLGAAAGAGPAERAEAALARFSTGLRVNHDGAPAHLTTLGHSYGSLVVGRTAHDIGLDTDDVIFVGSPGVGVARAADLGVGAGHVWSSTAAADPINLLRAGSGVRDPFVLGRTGPPDAQWFGTDPSSARFGAQVFESAPGSLLHAVDVHSAYFDEGNPALDTIALIARGDGG